MSDKNTTSLQWDKDLDELLKKMGMEGSPIDVIHSKLEAEFKDKLYIGFFGSPGAGKSTLMNKIAGKKLADAGVKPGVKLTEFAWGENDSIIFTDLPGFGGIPEEHGYENYWDEYEIDKFDVLICIFESKLNEMDVTFFKRAIDLGKKVIFVRSKSDAIYDEEIPVSELKKEIEEEFIKKVFGKEFSLLFVSSKTGEGIDELLFEISSQLDEQLKEKFFRNAKSYSESFLRYKEKASLKTVLLFSTLSAGTGAIMIPGIGAAIDIPSTIKMVKEIGRNFGLSEKRISLLESKASSDLKKYNLIISTLRNVGKEIVIKYVVENAGKEALKNVTKLIPIIGAGAGFALTYNVGKNTIKSCSELAHEIMRIELEEHYK
ncbi:GTPase [Bacillus sp. FJAT-49736]|uniref:GTPase n=1 Tax=Bacillus sp. FJAT-49736 TaxID=2833582 RepID=UPI001BC9F725|nr:GTPase [Bacillus sp. FJAT-49736]MBS4172869.1 50S ribosome-binding GTPase [Bacillus sp. FJAT-49736]